MTTQTKPETKGIDNHVDYHLKKGNISESKREDKNPMWKGDKVGYVALHQWVKKRKPRPEHCEICLTKSPSDLANISGEYKRDIEDYKWLCRACHMKVDGRLESLRVKNTKKFEPQTQSQEKSENAKRSL